MRKFLKVSIIILLLIGAFCLYILLFASNLKYSEEIVVNQNIDTVIVLFDNPYNMKEYMDGIESYEVLSGNLREVGTKAKIEVAMGDRKISMIEEIITKSLPEEMQVTYKADGVFNIVTNRFLKVSETQTKVINEQEFQFKGFMKIMGFLMPGAFKKQSRVYLANFKDFVEKKTEIESNEQDNKETIQVSKVIDTIYSDGTHYVGELKDNKKTGKGNCTYANGNTYIGEYENNLANGQGTYIGENGDTYIGKWQDNKPNGQGIYTWGEGPHYTDVYVGEFKDGNPHGQGTYTWGSGTNKGDEYIGEFMDNQKTGKGTCTYVNGDIYVGEWKDDKSHGQGIFTTTDGRILEGLFENGEYIDSAYQSNLNPEDVISDDDIVKE